jgi:16S rRNA A1518/A1519 N6-dimethyltransferase RsmA/KsgA/DIM1 with predicted DNA glycosylase/AP lyase activity
VVTSVTVVVVVVEDVVTPPPTVTATVTVVVGVVTKHEQPSDTANVAKLCKSAFSDAFKNYLQTGSVGFASLRRPNRFSAANVVNVVNVVVKDVLGKLFYVMRTGERCCSGPDRSMNQSKTMKRETLL